MINPILIFAHSVPAKLIFRGLTHLKFKLLLKLPLLFFFAKSFSFGLIPKLHLYVGQIFVFLLNFSLCLLFPSQLPLKKMIFVEIACLLYFLRPFEKRHLRLTILCCLQFSYESLSYFLFFVVDLTYGLICFRILRIPIFDSVYVLQSVNFFASLNFLCQFFEFSILQSFKVFSALNAAYLLLVSSFQLFFLDHLLKALLFSLL